MILEAGEFSELPSLVGGGEAWAQDARNTIVFQQKARVLKHQCDFKVNCFTVKKKKEKSKKEKLRMIKVGKVQI